MAQKVQIILTDDLTGEEGADETINFGLDGTNYEIDLTKKNADKLRKALAEYIGAARRVGRATGKAGKRTQVGPSSQEVRAWALSNGLDVPERGRIPATVREAYDAAN